MGDFTQGVKEKFRSNWSRKGDFSDPAPGLPFFAAGFFVPRGYPSDDVLFLRLLGEFWVKIRADWTVVRGMVSFVPSVP